MNSPQKLDIGECMDVRSDKCFAFSLGPQCPLRVCQLQSLLSLWEALQEVHCPEEVMYLVAPVLVVHSQKAFS